MKTLRHLLIVVLFFTSTLANGQTRLLALSKGDHTLAIVDPVSLKVLARIPVGPDPH